MKLSRKEYEEKMSKLQSKIEELKKAEISEETVFEIGKFYTHKDGTIVLCTNPAGESVACFSGVHIGGCKGFSYYLLKNEDGWVKNAFTEISPGDFTIKIKRN